MAIDVLSDRSYNGIKESVATAKNVATSTAKSAVAQKKVAVQSDDVVLTDSAKTLAKATDAARNASGIDEAKVEKLKAAISDGSYKINYESVANKLIDSEDELSSIFVCRRTVLKRSQSNLRPFCLYTFSKIPLNLCLVLLRNHQTCNR